MGHLNCSSRNNGRQNDMPYYDQHWEYLVLGDSLLFLLHKQVLDEVALHPSREQGFAVVEAHVLREKWRNDFDSLEKNCGMVLMQMPQSCIRYPTYTTECWMMESQRRPDFDGPMQDWYFTCVN